MDTNVAGPPIAVERFRARLALADRIMLALVIYSMGLALYAVYQWGIIPASTRVLYEWVGLGMVTGLVAVPVLLVMALMNWRRRFAGAALVCSSYVIGLGLWCFSLDIAWHYAGAAAALAGVAATGIGVIAVAAGGLALHGSLLAALGLGAASVVVVLIRRFGIAVTQ